MKVNVALALLMLSAGFCSAEETNNTDTVVALASRFVGSLASNDIDAAKACWLSVDELKAFVANPPAGVDVSNVDDDNLSHMKTQWELRDKEIAGCDFVSLHRFWGIIQKRHDFGCYALFFVAK